MKSDLFVSVAIGEDHFFQERANFARDLRSTRVKEREGLASNGQNVQILWGLGRSGEADFRDRCRTSACKGQHCRRRGRRR